MKKIFPAQTAVCVSYSYCAEPSCKVSAKSLERFSRKSDDGRTDRPTTLPSLTSTDVENCNMPMAYAQRQSSAVCCLLFAVCCFLFAVSCLPFSVCRFLFAVCCLLFAVCSLQFATCRLMFDVCCLQFRVCCLLFAACCLLFAVFCLQFAVNTTDPI